MKWTSFLVAVVALSIVFSALSFQTSARSASPCASCHGSYYQYLDILEGDSGNRIPTNLAVGQTTDIIVVIENLNNAPSFSALSSVSVTLRSQNNHFSVKTSTFSIGSLPTGKKTASWQITGISAGTDTLLITALGTNNHKSLSFSDNYAPPPSITVAPSGNLTSLAIALTAPSGGEAWLVGSKHNITRVASGGTGTLTAKLEYSSLSNSGPWTTIAERIPNNGFFPWTVPNAPSTNSYMRVTVFDSATPPQNASSVNTRPFTITTKLTPWITITQPSSDSAWSGGSVQTIIWNSNGKDIGNCQITLAYSTDNFDDSVHTIASRIADSGAFNWTLPRINSESVRIRAIIRDPSGQTSQDISEPFPIDSRSPSVRSVQPTDGLENVTATSISVTFSEPVDAATAEHAFSINPNVNGITWNWNSGQTTMTTSDLKFSANTTYTATIRAGVKDLSEPGNANTAPFSWSFTTGSATTRSIQPPVIIFEVQEPLIIPNKVVTFNASKTIAPASSNELLFSWDFGDGTPLVNNTNPAQAHSFSTEGKYIVKLKVSSISGVSEQTMDVLVRKQETATTSDSRDWHLVWAGLLISFAGTVGVYGSTFYRTEREQQYALNQPQHQPLHVPTYSPASSLHAGSRTRSVLPTLLLRSERCVGCGFCARKCPHNAITIINKKPAHDPSKCHMCMECANKCPRGSIRIIMPQTAIGG